jgi:hypothetical protein
LLTRNHLPDGQPSTVQATERAGSVEQQGVLQDMITQNRLADFETLVEVLAI